MNVDEQELFGKINLFIIGIEMIIFNLDGTLANCDHCRYKEKEIFR